MELQAHTASENRLEIETKTEIETETKLGTESETENKKMKRGTNSR